MATIKEDYVSFEISKLLKEKGFDEVCYRIYDTKEKELLGTDGIEFQNHEADEETITAPTLQMAMKWLREAHNIHISVYPFNRELPITENTSYTCDVATKKNSPMRGHLRGTWKTYEKACEAAILYCLEHLI